MQVLTSASIAISSMIIVLIAEASAAMQCALLPYPFGCEIQDITLEVHLDLFSSYLSHSHHSP